MSQNAIVGPESAVRTLRRFARPQKQVERCEFCGATLAVDHRHLLEVAARRIVCGCDPCALRFENVIGRWKLVPRDALALSNFQLTDGEWEEFALPINLAFFFHCTPANKVIAMYPSPAGATESLLPLSAWEGLVEKNPGMRNLRADVEALLVNRVGESRDYYIVPIDRCFELVGLIRLQWRGFSGGNEVWKTIGEFFGKLRVSAKVSTNEPQDIEVLRA